MDAHLLAGMLLLSLLTLYLRDKNTDPAWIRHSGKLIGINRYEQIEGHGRILSLCHPHSYSEQGWCCLEHQARGRGPQAGESVGARNLK